MATVRDNSENEAIEREYWRKLVASDEGRWLLKTLIRRSFAMEYLKYGASSGENTANRGKQDFIMLNVCDRLKYFFGYSVFDTIMGREVTNG